MHPLLQFFGMKPPSDSTPIPQLAINNELCMLQRKSEEFFIIRTNAQANSSDHLAVEVGTDNKFDLKNTTHTQFLNDCTSLFQKKSAQLHNIDHKIVGCVALGVVASSLSFLPLMGILGTLGWAATIYYINQRAHAYDEYYESLTLLVGACNWSLGQRATEMEVNSVEKITNHPTVRKMMAELYPVLTEMQVKHLIADDIQKTFTEELNNNDARNQFFVDTENFASNDEQKIALNRKGARFMRCIYGFNNGSATDFLEAIASFIPDLYRATLDGFQYLKNRWQRNDHLPDQDDTPGQQHRMN